MPTDIAPTSAFIAGLPKAELHLHLEGTLEPDLKLALAQRNGIDLDQKTVAEVQATYEFNDLASFLAVYYPAMEVLRTEQDFYDLAAAYLRRAADQGVRHAEMFFDPQAHTSRGVPFADVVNGYHRATVDARAELGISSSLILCFLRDMSAESAAQTFEEAVPFLDLIVGVGLDSDERDNPPRKFADTFTRARELGLKLTMHCDIDQVGSIEHIRQVIEEIGVDRIDHGTNIVEDPSLVDVVRERGIGLTSCPVSNSFVTSDMKADEIVQLLHDGVKIMINSDDPAYFGAYVAGNYDALVEKAGLSLDDVVRLAKNSFEASWLDDEAKAAHLAEIDAYVARATA